MKIPVINLFTENNQYQYIETLRRNRKKRNKFNEFFVEGVRSINHAIENDWEVNSFIFSREKRLSDWATNIINNSNAKTHFELPFSLLQKLSQKENTSELIALLAIPDDDFSRMITGECPLVVVVDRLLSPGNLGTIIRSCDALGVDGILMTGHSVDLYAPETIRARAGSFFSIPVIRKPSHNELLPWLEDLRKRFNKMQIVGTSASAEIPIQQHDFRKPTVLLIGSENHGLSVNYRVMSDFMVTISMFGSSSSINVACASSILLYEVARQRSL